MNGMFSEKIYSQQAVYTPYTQTDKGCERRSDVHFDVDVGNRARLKPTISSSPCRHLSQSELVLDSAHIGHYHAQYGH